GHHARASEREGRDRLVSGPAADDHDRRGADTGHDAQPLPPRSERHAPARAWRRTAHHRLHRLALERTPAAGVVMAPNRTAEGRSPTPALLLGLTVTLLAV